MLLCSQQWAGFACRFFFKVLPGLINLKFLAPFGFAVNNNGIYEIPFLDRMGFVFIICVVMMYVISVIDAKGKITHGLEIDRRMFNTSAGFAAGALLITGILVALYSLFW